MSISAWRSNDWKQAIVDWPTSQHVAQWSYGHAESVKARVWVARDDLEPLDGRWRALLA